jgi:hypothetical protein
MFRFSDPRVLSALVPTCTKDQIARLFGPVSRYLTEVDGGREMVEFRRNDNNMITTASLVI